MPWIAGEQLSDQLLGLADLAAFCARRRLYQQGIGFDAEDNQVLLLDRWGGTLELPRMSKLEVAHAILDRVLALRSTPKTRRAQPSH